MPNLQMKMVSSLEKCFCDESIESKAEQTRFTIFSGERLSFQVLYRNTLAEHPVTRACPVRLSGALAPYATVRQVVNVPSMYPVSFVVQEGAYLRKEPGMYPDQLRPLHYGGAVPVPYNQLHALWVDISLPEGFAAGTYDISLSIEQESGESLGKVTGQVRVLATALPPQTLIHTEWFYTDCIAEYYHVPAFSEAHWTYIESFLRLATANGINMILTPIFTPELDTYVGGERLTTQLLEITREAPGVYRFGFERLHRWIDLCLDCGVEYFEIPHFFTQWGAAHAPKIVVTVEGREEKLFGWHTDAMGEEYAVFLGQMIPAVLGEFKKRGLDKRCYFHVSDEPRLQHLEQYTRCRQLIGQYLEGYPIIDALSDFAFYEEGALDKPIPHTKSIEPFLEHKVPGLWAYYCASGKAVSDRFFSMPLCRTRILGVQLYLYNIEGFLHWGYNYYHNWRSYDYLDPFGCSDGEYFVPSGDAYLVYPGTDGEAWGSLRLNAMREAMDDIRALRLYESKFGREATERLILEGTDGSLTFTHYPEDSSYLLNLRQKIAEAFA